jgi:predicted acetyltransferase
MVELKRPSLALFPSFLEFSEEMRSNGESIWAPYLPQPSETPEQFVARIVRRETEPEPPLVPETIYWGVIGNAVVGRISLRHRLEGNLTKIGGHIGYEVRPSYRKRGIAKEMLRQILLTPKAREIGKLLLTCSPSNPASNKTIIANGGVYEKTIFVELVGEERNHYWIRVP